MSKEFKGTHWTITVNDEGYIRPDKNFWYSAAVGGVGYIGSLSALAPLFSLGINPKRSLKTLFTLIARGIPLQAATVELTGKVLTAFGRVDEKDLKAYEDARKYAKSVKEAYVKPEEEEEEVVSEPIDKSVDNVYHAAKDVLNDILNANIADEAKEAAAKALDDITNRYELFKERMGNNKEDK